MNRSLGLLKTFIGVLNARVSTPEKSIDSADMTGGDVLTAIALDLVESFFEGEIVT